MAQAGFNQQIIIGNLARDPEICTTILGRLNQKIDPSKNGSGSKNSILVRALFSNDFSVRDALVAKKDLIKNNKNVTFFAQVYICQK